MQTHFLILLHICFQFMYSYSTISPAFVFYVLSFLYLFLYTAIFTHLPLLVFYPFSLILNGPIPSLPACVFLFKILYLTNILFPSFMSSVSDCLCLSLSTSGSPPFRKQWRAGYVSLLSHLVKLLQLARTGLSSICYDVQ